MTVIAVISVIAQFTDAEFSKGVMILIFIDQRSRTPIYEQIKEQIIMLINTGVYKSDEQLPSIRALSNELNINVNTIKRALSELESDGVTYSVAGRGIFVSPNAVGNERIIKANFSGGC